ncbi:MAG: LamG-like jellyroll fold domain-containing protein [Planctomycetota bacterium]
MCERRRALVFGMLLGLAGTASYGYGTVGAALIDVNTVVTSVPPDPNTATNPNPANNQTRVPLEATLSWTPGCFAASHDVYLGTNFDDVNEANNSWPVGQSVYRGNQSLDANDYDPCCLASGIRHYWRIDEVDGAEVHRGRVWTFESRYVVPDIRLLFYRFNETSPNSIAHDCRESGTDADVNGPVDGWDPTGGHCNGCRVFNNDTAVIVPSEILYDVHWSISITVWVNGKIGQTPGKDMPIFDVGDPCRGAAYRMTALAPNANGHVVWRAGDDSNDVLVWEGASPQDWQGRWHHFAFLKDEYSGEMIIYFDGWPAASKSGVSASLAQIVGKPFKIGAYTYHASGYEGRLDDFKIWDMAQTRCRLRPSMCMPPPPYAWAPRPYNGEVNVAPDANLVWEPGDDADSHNVYFGTDLSDVNGANTTSDVYQGNQGPNVFDLNILDLETGYFWRIDEVNTPNVWKGQLWQFTTANYIVVDDFESYDPGTHHIFYAWQDGIFNNTGSFIDLGLEPFSPVHGGQVSLAYFYDNTGYWGTAYYSEAERAYDPPQDWTSLGTKALTLYFYGDPDNDANDTEQLYVGLGGSYAQVNYADMNDVKKSEWTEWNIAIADFTGVDPCAVTSLFIGFGDRDNNTVPGGEGFVYFDDIRLYLPRCVPDRAKPFADLNDDCVVDYKDLKIMADEWLCSGGCAADLYPDGKTDLKDCAILVNLWLERELWPE